MHQTMMQEQNLNYHHRPRPFGGEVSFELEQETLIIDTGRKVERWRLADIAVVRLTYEPKSVVWHGFRMTLTGKDGRKLSMTNLNWKSYVHVDRQDADYARFVSELISRVEDANPRVMCIAGKTAPLYYATALMGGMTCVLMVGMAGLAIMKGAVAYGVLAGLFILPFASMSWALTTRNRPEFFTSPAIPSRVLPDQDF